METQHSTRGLMTTVLLLLVHGITWFQPVQPFTFDYYTKVSNISDSNVTLRLYPVWTYSYTISIFLFGIITSIFGIRSVNTISPCISINSYKLLIILGLVGNFVTYVLMLVTKSFPILQLGEVTFGLFFAGMLILTSYQYLLFKEERYQRISSYVRAVILVSIVGSSLLGQILVDYTSTSLYVLVIITAATALASTLLSVALPSPPSQEKHDIYIKPDRVLYSLWNTYKGNWMLIAWSLWGSVTLGIHQLVLTYWQNLFSTLDSSTSNIKGYIFAGAYLLAAGSSMVPIKLEKSGKGIPIKIGHFLLVLFPFIYSVLLVLLANSHSLVLSSVAFILYQIAFEFMNPIVSAKVAFAVAERISADSEGRIKGTVETQHFGSVFALNTLLALGFQSLLQIVVGSSGLSLPVRIQFDVFGGVNAIVGLVSLGTFVVQCLFFKRAGYLSVN